MSNPIIESQRAKVADIERKLDYERAVLHGMELISGASQNPPVMRSRHVPMQIVRGSLSTARGTGGGKQPGQLSMPWRSVLEKFYVRDMLFSDVDAAELYQQITGKELMRARDVRHKLKAYADEHRFVEIESDGRFRVTEVAAGRFGFVRTPKDDRVIDLTGGHSTLSPLFGDREGGEALSNPNNPTS